MKKTVSADAEGIEHHVSEKLLKKWKNLIFLNKDYYCQIK